MHKYEFNKYNNHQWSYISRKATSNTHKPFHLNILEYSMFEQRRKEIGRWTVHSWGRSTQIKRKKWRSNLWEMLSSHSKNCVPRTRGFSTQGDLHTLNSDSLVVLHISSEQSSLFDPWRAQSPRRISSKAGKSIFKSKGNWILFNTVWFE